MNGHTVNGKFHPHSSSKPGISSGSVNPSTNVKIQGHDVKLGKMISVKLGKTDASIKKVKLVEQHKKAPSKICIQNNHKKYLVSKSSVVF